MYYIGQTFIGSYSPQVAVWCNKNNCHLERNGDTLTIVENPPPPETIEVRTFSKFKIWEKTFQMPYNMPDGTLTTVWDMFEQFLIDSRLRVGYEMLDVLEDDNIFFKTFYPKACEVFSKDLVDSILAYSLIKTEFKEVQNDSNNRDRFW